MLPTKSSCFFHYKQNMLPTTNACFLLTEPAGENPIVQEQEQEPNRRKDMTEKLRQQVYQALLTRSNNGTLHKKDTAFVAAQFGKPIFIQQDNAPFHLKLDDPLFCEAAKHEGFDIRLICQPPNSPDFNILDLSFFRAIQAIQYKKNAKCKR